MVSTRPSLALCLLVALPFLRQSTSAGQPLVAHMARDHGPEDATRLPKVVCYYIPASYFPSSLVPARACTHLIYAFGSLDGSGSSPNITRPTPGQANDWRVLTALRQQNPELKVLLSLQKGFPTVVGPNTSKMTRFAVNSLAYLRKFGFDGVDLDWEFPTSEQKDAFAKFMKIMRDAITREAKTTKLPPLLLSMALTNSPTLAHRGYDIATVASTMDFATAMTYDFHMFNKRLNETLTDYNSPLYSPPGDAKNLCASAIAEFYVSSGLPAGQLLLGMSTYGRSWRLVNPAVHGYHAPANANGDPGPCHHFRGVYTYPDACLALQQGATRVGTQSLGAAYLYKGNAWVAYDDVMTVTVKCRWVLARGLGGVGVWALHLDDISGVCGHQRLPLISTMRSVLLP